MKKVKDTIKNDASYSSGDVLKTVQSVRGNPINVTRKFYDVTFISRFVTSMLHLHKAQDVRACHNYANNKGVVVRCLDSIIPLVSISKISSLYLASVVAQFSLSLLWLQTRRQVFSWRGSNDTPSSHQEKEVEGSNPSGDEVHS